MKILFTQIVVLVVIVCFAKADTAIDANLLVDKTWECVSTSDNIVLKSKDVYYENGTFVSNGLMSIHVSSPTNKNILFDNPVSGIWSVDDNKFITKIIEYKLKNIDNTPNSKVFETDSLNFDGEDTSTITILTQDTFATKGDDGIGQECKILINN